MMLQTQLYGDLQKTQSDSLSWSYFAFRAKFESLLAAVTEGVSARKEHSRIKVAHYTLLGVFIRWVCSSGRFYRCIYEQQSTVYYIDAYTSEVRWRMSCSSDYGKLMIFNKHELQKKMSIATYEKNIVSCCFQWRNVQSKRDKLSN